MDASSNTNNQSSLGEFREHREEANRHAITPRCGTLSLFCIWLVMALFALGTLACLFDAVRALFQFEILRMLGAVLAAGVSHGFYSALGLLSDYGAGKK